MASLSCILFTFLRHRDALGKLVLCLNGHENLANKYDKCYMSESSQSDQFDSSTILVLGPGMLSHFEAMEGPQRIVHGSTRTSLLKMLDRT